MEYQDYCINTVHMDMKSYKPRRSKIIDFLISDFMKDINVESITQEVIENYFMSYLRNERDNTYNSRYSYIKAFFDYHAEKIANKIEFEGLRLKKSEVNESEFFVRNPLSAKQIALCMDEYKNDLKKLYIFEMFYYTQFTKEDLKNITYSDFDVIEGSFNYNGRKEYVPDNLISVIEQLKEEPILTRYYDVDYIIEQMKEDLRKHGVMNFKPKDLIATRQNVFWKCPQCGSQYEATVDNWCAKQYTEDGNLWIVCRKNCGRND